MTGVIWAVVIVSAIGIVAGILLSVASEIFAVPKNETEEKIRECLPGANCGACGFSGCDGYAAALAKGETESVSQCAPGGNAVAKKIGILIGKEATAIKPMAAVVMCGGDCDHANDKLEYQGVMSCKAAMQLYGGHKSCPYGCLGYGDCMNACPYEAITMCNGVARVNTMACHACRACQRACPKGLIEMLPLETTMAAVLCHNHDKGAQTRKDCTYGCIGCGKCTRTCPNGAVTMDNFVAKVDPELCTGCGLCHEACPVKCIDLIRLN